MAGRARRCTPTKGHESGPTLCQEGPVWAAGILCGQVLPDCDAVGAGGHHDVPRPAQHGSPGGLQRPPYALPVQGMQGPRLPS